VHFEIKDAIWCCLTVFEEWYGSLEVLKKGCKQERVMVHSDAV